MVNFDAQNYAAQKPIEVQCKCGWRGKSDELIGMIQSDKLHCPKCTAPFNSYPK